MSGSFTVSIRKPEVLRIRKPDDPKKFAAQAKRNHAAGIFAWRLDNDSAEQGFPTFADAIEMWRLMHQPVPYVE